MAPTYYFEDLSVGDTFEFDPVMLTEDDIVAFGREYDPLPFHVDAEAAADSVFGGLIASGIQLIAVSQRVVYEGFYSEAALLGGLGMDDVRFEVPCRPGDTLTTRVEVVELRESQSRDDRGIAATRRSLHTDDGTIAASMINRFLIGRRETA